VRDVLIASSVEERRTKDRDREGKVERSGCALLWTCWCGVPVVVVSWLKFKVELMFRLMIIGARLRGYWSLCGRRWIQAHRSCKDIQRLTRVQDFLESVSFPTDMKVVHVDEVEITATVPRSMLLFQHMVSAPDLTGESSLTLTIVVSFMSFIGWLCNHHCIAFLRTIVI
jgi:hypothetical protein